MHRAADVDGGEDREDEGLQDRDQNLEPGHEDQHCKGPDGSDVGGAPQDLGEHGEGDQQKVACDHVGPEPDCQREGPHHERRDKLDGGHDQVQRNGYARREEGVLEVAAEALGPDSDEVVDHPDHYGQGDRYGHAAVRRELDARDHLEDVREHDEEEHRGEERHELAALGPNGLHDHRILDEVDAGFGDVLDSGWHEGRLGPAGQGEYDTGDDHGSQIDERRLVDGVRRSGKEDVGPLEEMADRREFER